MLSAKSNKEIVYAYEITDENENEMRNKTLLCSCCNEEVNVKIGRKILKNGEKMVSHFAHLKDSDCPDPKESQEHLLTKISIFKNLKNMGLEPVMEENYTLEDEKIKKIYIKKVKELYSNNSSLKLIDSFWIKLFLRGKFRPDIGFEYNEQPIVIEVQKSYLPEEDFLLRTLFYKILGIKVLWLIPEAELLKNIEKSEDGKMYINEDGDYYFKISKFHETLKKYYYGNIYTWNNETEKLKVFNFNDVSRYIPSYDGDSGSYGGYEKTYKKTKILKCIHEQGNIISNFEFKNVERNEKFQQDIEAEIWAINYNTLKNKKGMKI